MTRLLFALAAVFSMPSIAQEAVDDAGPPIDDVDALTPAVDTSRILRSATADEPLDEPAAEPPPATADEPPAAPAAAPSVRSAPAAVDRLDLGTTSITGNQELPKVLYIVPWKRSDLGDLVGRPVNTLLDEVLAPVDPEVFERHLSYYETLHGDSEEE